MTCVVSFQPLAVRSSSYGCTREVWSTLKKLELLSAVASSNSYASFVLSKFSACIQLDIRTLRMNQFFFTITAEIHARSLANCYRQYADRRMNLKFMYASASESGQFDNLLS